MYNLLFQMVKIIHFQVCVTVLTKIKIRKCSYVINFCSECPGTFFPDEEMNDNEDIDILFICFYHCEHVIFYYWHNELLPEHGKEIPLRISLKNVWKGRFTTQKSILLISIIILDFSSGYYIPVIEKLIFIYHIFTFL